MKFTDKQLAEMVDSLEQELKKSLEQAKSEIGQLSLAKSEDKAEEEKKEESKEEPKKEESKEEPAKEESKDEKKEESKEEDKGHEDDHGYDEQDLEELHKMYDAMKRGEHKAHLGALKKAMTKCWKSEDMDKCWKGEQEQKDMEKCGEMSVQKSEKVEAEPLKSESKPEESSLLKSEIETLKKENEDLKKSVDGLIASMNTFFSKKQAPARKAITDVEFVKKSEETSEKPLTKSEVDQILKKKVTDPKLSPADRQAINSFYLNNAGLERIKHLLG
jgi:hypothetical protein